MLVSGLLDDDALVTEISDAHRELIRLLENSGLCIIEEQEFPPYTVDIYLPDVHLGVEVDGPHHELKRDARRDEQLLNDYLLPVLHVSTKLRPEDALTQIYGFVLRNIFGTEGRIRAARELCPWV